MQIDNLDGIDHVKFLQSVTSYCNCGKPMHREALKSVVHKLTEISRNLNLEQDERDAAATLATGQANAGLKAYGSSIEFGCALKSGIESVINGTLSPISKT